MHRAVSVAVLLVAYIATLAAAQGASQFKGFLLDNHLPNGSIPLSFAVPPDYFSGIPQSLRDHHYPDDASFWVAPCGNNISGAAMNNYSWQSEIMLTTLGLNIYDGAVRCIALSLLDEAAACLNYTYTTLVNHKTIQFPDIRGDHTCRGVMEYGQCTDPMQGGVCGFCYGDGAQKTATVQNAYFYRMIADYWAIEGTVDARCPLKNMLWTWDDYKPILGENSWAILTGPLHNAMIRYNYDASKIPDSDPCFTLAIPFLDVLDMMKVGTTGAIYYTPRNTWFGFSNTAQNIGSTFSIENQASLLAGLQALYNVLRLKPNSQYYNQLPRIANFIAGLKKILLAAFDPNRGFFRQGATYDPKTGNLDWSQNGEPDFAVDCQTWVSSVLGTPLIDSTFGVGTAYNIWQLTKLYANYSLPNGMLGGVGYSFNNLTGGQVLSGEWTYGAINWLRVMVNDSNYNATLISNLQDDISNMQYGTFANLVVSTQIQNSTNQYNSVLYASQRYYIPFGWWASAIPSLASTSWAVFMYKNYNPLNIYGWYAGSGVH